MNPERWYYDTPAKFKEEASRKAKVVAGFWDYDDRRLAGKDGRSTPLQKQYRAKGDAAWSELKGYIEGAVDVQGVSIDPDKLDDLIRLLVHRERKEK